ncbi:hypothetical protein FDECE_14971 [Fusarium decemcellulare]|nr:hypothetical protein FDECE_14971 [Fusarium decemcellulare]
MKEYIAPPGPLQAALPTAIPINIPGLTLAQSKVPTGPAGPPPKSAPTKPKYKPPRLKKKSSPPPKYIRPSTPPPPRHANSSSPHRAPTGPKHDEGPHKRPASGSGGVPNPAPAYLTQALLEPHRNPQPRRILVVMDLNGTLLHRPNHRRPFHFIQRPHATAFLSYCLDTFYVAIWSSARPENVERMVSQLLTPEQRDRCLLIWGRDSFNLTKQDYDSKVQVYKRLTSVWSDPRVMAAHPSADSGGRWDQSNTVLVDDSQEKARSEPFNLLQIPEFVKPSDEPPNVLPQVHDYLNTLAHEADISRFVRRSPFKLDPNYTLPQDPVDNTA